jgi:hypothetical protein
MTRKLIDRLGIALCAWSLCLLTLNTSLIQVAAASGVHALAPVTGSDGHFGAVEAFRTDQSHVAYDAGVKWERLTFWWSGLQAGPGQDLNPFYLPMNYVDKERQNGITVVGLLINTPDWAASDPSEHTASVPKNLALPYNDPNNYWGQFVSKVVRQYAGHIDNWVIWNEPDIQSGDPNAVYRTWAGSTADYYQLLKVAYQAAHAANPNVTVVTAGVTYWGDVKAGRHQYFDRFLDQVVADPTAASHGYYFDKVAVHLYVNPDGLYTVPVLFHAFMHNHGFDKPTWINEMNVIPYDDPVNAGTERSSPRDLRSTLDEQASFIIEGFAMGLAAGVERIEVYKMKDGDGDVISGQALVYNNLQLRPAYVSFQVAASYFSNARSATLFSAKEVREVVFDRGGQRTTAVWTTKPSSLVVRVPASGKNATIVDQYGTSTGVSATDGFYTLTLDPATMHTNQDDPEGYLIGGHPMLLIEQGTDGASIAGIPGSSQDYQDVNDGRSLAVNASGPPPLASVAPTPTYQSGGANCSYALGFKSLFDMIPATIGACVDNEAHAANGDALQHSTRGLLVWRKSDNWTAFTNGAQTWINGPYGLVTRPNNTRFSWESNPEHLPVVPD